MAQGFLVFIVFLKGEISGNRALHTAARDSHQHSLERYLAVPGGKDFAPQVVLKPYVIFR